MQANHPNATLEANPTKQKIVGTEPMLPTIHDPSVTTHKNVKGTPLSHNQRTNQKMNQKTITPRLRFGETVDARAYSPEDPPHHIHNRHNSRMHWYSNRKLAETTSHRLHKETTPRKRTGNNIPARSRLQKRSSKSHKSIISANHQYQGTLCYNTNRQQ